MTRSGYDKMEKKCLKTLNIASDGADDTYGGRLFQKVAPETGKARLPSLSIRFQAVA